MQKKSLQSLWSSRFIFILAATGSAVGLGNIWKFPYITGVNGGGAFVLVYLLCVLAIGIPILMAEILLGRRGRKDPINCLKYLAAESGKSPLWKLLGWMGVIAGFLILSYYSVIAGWAMAYVPYMASGMFSGQGSDFINQQFDSLVSSPTTLVAWHTIFMFMTMFVISKGVRRGLENAIKYLMPTLFILLLVLLFYSYNYGAFSQGLSFLFSPDFSKISSDGILSAMGHAFFTLSLGMGAIMVYGSYLPKDASITSSAIWIALFDTIVALVAGMVIFPIVFANGLEAAAGPGLIFKTIPVAFSQMSGGTFFGSLFFIVLVFAAWTSSISLIEPAVVWLMDKFSVTRFKASIILGFLVWSVGLLSAFSFNILSEVTFSQSIVTSAGEFVILKDASIFDVLDYLTSNIMLPLGGLLIALFVAWKMKKEYVHQEIAAHPIIFPAWQFLLKFVAPTAVLIVFMNALGILAFIMK
ncbi:MAG: sodium-dependent transporter [Gammaproteobacteria bacterium]|nr:sodium-dependent transporter [Gammaproteobacteria bacterium]